MVHLLEWQGQDLNLGLLDSKHVLFSELWQPEEENTSIGFWRLSGNYSGGREGRKWSQCTRQREHRGSRAERVREPEVSRQQQRPHKVTSWFPRNTLSPPSKWAFFHPAFLPVSLHLNKSPCYSKMYFKSILPGNPAIRRKHQEHPDGGSFWDVTNLSRSWKKEKVRNWPGLKKTNGTWWMKYMYMILN